MSVPRKSSATRSMPLITRGRDAAEHRALVARALHRLAADDHVGVAVAQMLERAAVEVEIAQVDLLADHERAARLEDAAAQRLAVVRLAERERADLGPLVGEVRGELGGAIARAVLGEDDLERQLGRVERAADGVEAVEQLGHRLAEDALLVVDGDHDRDVGRPRGHRVPLYHGCDEPLGLARRHHAARDRARRARVASSTSQRTGSSSRSYDSANAPWWIGTSRRARRSSNA